MFEFFVVIKYLVINFVCSRYEMGGYIYSYIKIVRERFKYKRIGINDLGRKMFIFKIKFYNSSLLFLL